MVSGKTVGAEADVKTLAQPLCQNCGGAIRRLRQHSKAQHRLRKFCSQSCNSKVTQGRKVRSPAEMRKLLRSRIEVDENGCWNARMAQAASGYRTVQWGNKPHKAHRVAYEVFIGPITDGLHVLHRCDNRKCINPKHLFLGTNADNVRDRAEKGRSARGQANGVARITEADVRVIRSSDLTNRQLGERFGLAPHTVSGIRNGRSWRHVA